MSKLPKIYFIGIAGTGMGAVACLFKSLGYEVLGSDLNIFPPISNLLEDSKIQVLTPYKEENILNHKDSDMFVIANCLSRGHLELEAVISNKLPYTSFPELLGSKLLKDRCSLVVCGTHGKTTTSTMLAYLLEELSENPGYLIGGVPQKEGGKSFQSCKKNELFVIEGDEYDTAFFDKESKFLHYFPSYIIFNNLEFDHADIFSNLDAIKTMFLKLFEKYPEAKIVANSNDSNVMDVLKKVRNDVILVGLNELTTSLSAKDYHLYDIGFVEENGVALSTATLQTPNWGALSFQTKLLGRHNLSNWAHALSLLSLLENDKKIKPVDTQKLLSIIKSFEGVKKRMQFLGEKNGVPVYFDFAHHPTAVLLGIEALRQKYPKKRLIVAFEPSNATSRRNIFFEEYLKAFQEAHIVLMPKARQDERIPVDKRWNSEELTDLIGPKAKAFDSSEDVKNWLEKHLIPEDVVVFMSSSSFSGIPYSLLDKKDSQVS